MSIEKVNTNFFENLEKLQHQTLRECFQNKVDRLLISSQSYKLFNKSHFINYTSIYNSSKHHIGIGSQIKGVQSEFDLNASLQYIYTIDLINQVNVGIRLNRTETAYDYDFSIYKQFTRNCLMTYCINVDEQQAVKWKFLLNYKESQIKLKEQGLSMVISPITEPHKKCQISPYLKTNFNHPETSTIGMKAKLKQFELFCYKQLSQKTGLNFGILLNIDHWKVGFKLSLGSEQGFISLFLSKLGIAVQFPFYQIEYDNLVDKYTCVGFFALIACSLLKCLQQPKILPPSKQERIEKSRMVLDLLENKTKQIYQHEKGTNGLLIQFAYYGNSEHIKILNQQANKLKFHLQCDLEILDVTLACQAQVMNSSLQLPSYSKSVLIGFCDPCENMKTKKSLLLEYVYQQQRYSRIFDDLERVQVP